MKKAQGGDEVHISVNVTFKRYACIFLYFKAGLDVLNTYALG